jgi:nucleotide-binding universal stress UspA family protein
MATAAPEGDFLNIVVGYDGSPPAVRALDAAAGLLRGRPGRIDVVWVAHLSSATMLSADAIAEMESGFDELERDLQAQAAGQLTGQGLDWGFGRRQGIITEELADVAAGIHSAHPDRRVVIVVGSSSHATHRMVGSVAVGLARHSPVPLVVVP